MIRVTTADGLTHMLPNTSPEAIAAYSSSLNTRQALQTAIAAGHYETVADPEPVAPAANWFTFYNALLTSTAFQHARTAARGCVACNVSYTDLANALALAAQGNVNEPAIQAGYDSLKADLVAKGEPFTTEYLAELQALATSNYIQIVW